MINIDRIKVILDELKLALEEEGLLNNNSTESLRLTGNINQYLIDELKENVLNTVNIERQKQNLSNIVRM